AAPAAYERALALKHEHGAQQEVLRALGEVALDQHDWNGAAPYWTARARLGNDSPFLWMEFAQALMGRHEWQRAIEALREMERGARGDNRAVVPILREI